MISFIGSIQTFTLAIFQPLRLTKEQATIADKYE